ncbi:Ribosomal L18p/L5e family protein [Perilla frutescens var. hirtella]|nr:Ribosomal L18p/L5e family protein [Perilla frutescens var. hirtella]
MLRLACRKSLSQIRGFHSTQGPRSFFGVDDFLDDDNGRPYTYQREKKSKNPNKHVSFKQRTVAYMESFTLDVLYPVTLG